MIGGLWNGLSGLNTFDRALSTESNNATNVNTVGHKSDEIRFEDLMYQNGYGKGSAVETISKKITQGDLKHTGYKYDVAIEGKGYFIVNERITNETYYTRAGNFKMGKDGLLETQDGLKVYGITPPASTVISSDPTQNQFSNEYDNLLATTDISNNDFVQTINARSTDYRLSAEAGGINGNGFKSKSTKLADVELLAADYREKLSLYRTTSTEEEVASSSQVTDLNYTNFLNNLNTENDSIKVTINNVEILQKFEKDIETTLKNFSDKISNTPGLTSSVNTDTGVVTINSLIPGKEVKINTAAINDDAVIITDTQIANVGSGIGIVNSSRNALQNALENAGAKLMDITTTISLENEKDLNVNEIQLKLANLNLSKNVFGEIEIVNDKIFLNDNGNKFIVGKLETALFTNEQGLSPEGNNLYKQSKDSGIAKYAGEMNTLYANTLELSNANTGESLTNLLVYQKAFEANSKSITTSDELLKTAINLRK